MHLIESLFYTCLIFGTLGLVFGILDLIGEGLLKLDKWLNKPKRMATKWTR